MTEGIQLRAGRESQRRIGSFETNRELYTWPLDALGLGKSVHSHAARLM